jgi:MscS family membrane protein
MSLELFVMAFLPVGIDYDMLKNIGISIGILVLFILFRNLFTKYVFQLILKLSRKHQLIFLHKFV